MSITQNRFVLIFVILETFSAINRSVLFWFEWYLTFISTVATCCSMHFSRSVVSAKSRTSVISITSTKVGSSTKSRVASICWFVILEAFSAINRFVFPWFEWYLTFSSAVATGCLKHFSFSFKGHIFLRILNSCCN